MKVLVCGGRDYHNKLRVWAILHEIQAETPITYLIHGGARGADLLGASWATSTNGVATVRCDANWARDGRAAGPIRNHGMLGLNPDLVVAFPGGRGTDDMIRQAQKAGVRVMIVVEEKEARAI